MEYRGGGVRAGRRFRRDTFPRIRVDLNEECLSVYFFSIFPKFRYFPVGKYREIPNFRESPENPLKNSTREFFLLIFFVDAFSRPFFVFYEQKRQKREQKEHLFSLSINTYIYISKLNEKRKNVSNVQPHCTISDRSSRSAADLIAQPAVRIRYIYIYIDRYIYIYVLRRQRQPEKLYIPGVQFFGRLQPPPGKTSPTTTYTRAQIRTIQNMCRPRESIQTMEAWGTQSMIYACYLPARWPSKEYSEGITCNELPG